jgi:hypothetical protein
VPEPSWAGGLFAGLLALSTCAPRSKRSRANRSAVNMSIGLALITSALLFASPAASLTADFEDLGLDVESYENGAGLAGGYTSGGIFFENNYTPDFGGFFDGYAASTITDNTTPGFGNQFSNITGSGAGGSASYGIGFSLGSILLPTPTLVIGAEFTNTTYAALSMLNGDSFAKKFGGADGTEADFFRLLIEGVDAFGFSTGTAELMLADYTAALNEDDYILDEWTFLDLSGLGIVSELRFSFESSDIGSFGINTPTYFAIDNLVTVPEPGTALLLGLGLGCLSRRQRSVRSPRC